MALVSDAGTPLVADPGYRLAVEAAAAGHAVMAVPGASALLAALAVAALPTDRFLFAGFLPPRATGAAAGAGGARARCRRRWSSTSRRGGCAESLADMAAVLGAGRAAAVCRELTKRFEEARRGAARGARGGAGGGAGPEGRDRGCGRAAGGGGAGDGAVDAALAAGARRGLGAGCGGGGGGGARAAAAGGLCAGAGAGAGATAGVNVDGCLVVWGVVAWGCWICAEPVRGGAGRAAGARLLPALRLKRAPSGSTRPRADGRSRRAGAAPEGEIDLVVALPGGDRLRRGEGPPRGMRPMRSRRGSGRGSGRPLRASSPRRPTGRFPVASTWCSSTDPARSSGSRTRRASTSGEPGRGSVRRAGAGRRSRRGSRLGSPARADRRRSRPGGRRRGGRRRRRGRRRGWRCASGRRARCRRGGCRG